MIKLPPIEHAAEKWEPQRSCVGMGTVFHLIQDRPIAQKGLCGPLIH